MANDIDAEHIADKISLAAAKTDEALNNTYKKISILLTVFENIVSSVDDFQVKVGSLNVTLTELTVTSNQTAQYIDSLANSADQAAESVGDINSKMASSDIKEYTDSLIKANNQLKNVVKSEKKVSEAVKERSISESNAAEISDAAFDAFGEIISTTELGSSQILSLTNGVKDLIHSLIEGASAGSVIGAGISIVTSLITMGIEAIKKAEEERKKAFEEGVKNLDRYSKEYNELNRSLNILSSAKDNAKDLTEARSNLISTFKDMVVGYNYEGEAILANNEQLEKQIELLNKKIALSRQEIIQNGDAADIPVIEAYKIISAWTKYLQEEGESVPVELSKREIELYTDAQKYMEAYLQEYIKVKDANSELILSWENLSQAQQTVGNSLKLDYFDEVINGTKSLDEALWEIQIKLSDTYFVEEYKRKLMNLTQNAAIEAEWLSAAYNDVNTAVNNSLSGISNIQSDMAAAYSELTENGKLSQSTINSLISTYPQLIDYLDSETGHLNLTEDTMRELYEIQKQLQIAELESAKAKLAENEEIIRSNYEIAKSELVAARNDINSFGSIPEKFVAVEKAENQLKELENSYHRIDTLISHINNTELDLSNSTNQTARLSEAVDKLNTSVAQSISNLSGYQSKMASAYNELTENGNLSQSTINSLISSYPQLIDYLDAETGQLNLTEDTMRELYEIQKQLQIAELEESKEKLRQNESKIRSNYKLAESELLAAQSALMTSGTNQWRIDQYYEKSSAYKDAKKEMEELQANYNRIDTLIETINNTQLDLTAEGNGIKTTTKSVSEYSQALEKLNHQKRMGQLSTKEEIAALEELGRKYVLSADERIDLEYRIYSAKKQYEEEIENARAKALQDQYTQMDNLKSLGKLNAEQELEWLEKIRKSYKMNAEERIALEIKIYNLKEELRQNEVSALDDLGAAITEALKNQYEEQRKAEKDRINESIEAWEQWEKSTVEAIQAEIDALDALEKEQESQSAAAEYYRKSQELKLQIAYEKDDYQRKQLEKELNRLTEEEEKRLRKEQLEKQKEELQNQIDEARDTAEERKKALEEELEVIDENYDKLTSALSLRAQAEQIIMQQSQENIISLIKSYAPEYDLAGQSIGESLYEAFKSKVDNIYSYIEEVMAAIRQYQENAKAAAVQAANDFEQSYRSGTQSSQPPNSVNVYYTSNFNTPVQSPVQTKRAIESTASNIAAMIR